MGRSEVFHIKLRQRRGRRRIRASEWCGGTDTVRKSTRSLRTETNRETSNSILYRTSMRARILKSISLTASRIACGIFESTESSCLNQHTNSVYESRRMLESAIKIPTNSHSHIQNPFEAEERIRYTQQTSSEGGVRAFSVRPDSPPRRAYSERPEYAFGRRSENVFDPPGLPYT